MATPVVPGDAEGIGPGEPRQGSGWRDRGGGNWCQLTLLQAIPAPWSLDPPPRLPSRAPLAADPRSYIPLAADLGDVGFLSGGMDGDDAGRLAGGVQAARAAQAARASGAAWALARAGGGGAARVLERAVAFKSS